MNINTQKKIIYKINEKEREQLLINQINAVYAIEAINKIQRSQPKSVLYD